jgi:hypothetical protein
MRIRSVDEFMLGGDLFPFPLLSEEGWLRGQENAAEHL